MTLTGGCLCGAVRYEVDQDPVWAHSCHCSRCRRITGSAFAANLFVPLDSLRYTRGRDDLETYRPPEAERFITVFCRRCGSTLPFRNPARGLSGIPMGSLDDDPHLGLKAQIWVDSRAPWFEIDPSLPQHPEALGSG